jgi:hypothetical protein
MMLVGVAWIVICGALIGTASMLLYARLSPQQEVAKLNARIKAARADLADADQCDMGEVWLKTVKAISLSLNQFRLILLPTLAAALLIIVLAWYVDTGRGLSRLALYPSWLPTWLCSEQVAFWIPLVIAALATKWIYAIK